MKVIKNQMIRMRDGIHLATDIYLPEQTETTQQWPVVIERTPYDKEAQSRSELKLGGELISRLDMAKRFTDQGFVLVFQDCRGRYQSEGEFVKYINEAEDGLDSLDWIQQQEWCNGDIGSMGLSYAAHTQLALACLNPKALKTMVLDSGGFYEAFQCGIRQGGAFELKQATWAYRQAINKVVSTGDTELLALLKTEDLAQWFKQMPWKKGHSPLRHLPEYEDYLFEQWSQDCFSEYWEKIGIYAKGYFDQIPDISVLFMSSWYDAYVTSTLNNFLAFSSEDRTAKHEVIMGPWLHGDRNSTHSGEVEFGEQAAFDRHFQSDWLDYRIEWFKKHLLVKQLTTAHDLNVFVMGGGSGQKLPDQKLAHGGHWIKAQSWPIEQTTLKSLYLSAGEKLCVTPTASQASYDYCYDPANPVPTIGGAVTSGKPIFWGGAFDQREKVGFFGSQENNQPLSNRPDVLAFESEILEQDLLVAGPVNVELWISSDAADTDFTAKLIDIYPASEDYPEGFAMNISDGIIRSRFRNSWQHPEQLNAGEVVKVEIKAFDCCNLFKKGHRIRLDISSSNFPHFDLNFNYADFSYQGQDEPRKANNTVYAGGEYPSAIHLYIADVN